MWTVDLPRVGTPEDPTPCLGDVRFTTARTARTVRKCREICAGCHWQMACHDLARALVGAGERVSGVWAGIDYGRDQERADDEPHVDDPNGHPDWSLLDHPPRVVRIAGTAAARPSYDDPAESAVPQQRSAEPW